MVLSDHSGGDIGWKKWLIAGWGFMECLFFGGLLYGWGSLVFVLKNEGIYSNLCEEETEQNSSSGNISDFSDPSDLFDDERHISMATLGEGQPCKAQDDILALCFTIGSTAFCIGSAITGHISYKYGTRVTRLIAFASLEAGAICMAFASKDIPWLIFPGLSLLGIGGLPLLVTNAQISNLFMVGSSAVVGLFAGGFDSSSAVMLLLKLLSDNGITNRQTMFSIIAIAHILLLVSTFFFLPKTFIPRKSPIVDKERLIERSEKEDLLPKKAIMESETKDRPSLMECVKSTSFITHVIWLSLLQLRFFYFIGSLNDFLGIVLDHDIDLVSQFTNACYYTMMCGLVFSFIAGLVYDFQKWKCRDGKTRAWRETVPAVLPLSIASFLSVLMSILVLIPNQSVLYFTFIVLTVKRSFLYSLAAGFLSALFPSDYFGVLYGIMIVSGGVVGFLQYGFFTWSKAYLGGTFHANACLLLLVCLSFIHPLSLYRRSWREEKERRMPRNDSL